MRLPRLIGHSHALDLILTGRIVEASEAHTMGLVTEVVPSGGALARALEMAEGLAAFPQETMLADPHLREWIRSSAAETVVIPYEEVGAGA